MKTHLQGRYGTGQSDGWKSIAKTSIIASMINAEYDPYILHSHDVTEQPKTAENLLKIVDAEIEFCEKVLKVILAAWCTDGGGDCAKMRRLLKMKRPDLATPHCWSHQIRLTVGDYLKLKTPAVSVLDTALEIIKWFNNHSGALALLRQEQMKRYGQVLSFPYGWVRRFTAHYISSDRLLELEHAFRSLVLDAKAKLVACAGKERAQIDKAKSLIEQLEQPAFWCHLREARDHLEPLAIASNATQGDNARLDVVLVTLASLYLIYSDASPERDLYILAVVLNPFLRLAPLRGNNLLLTHKALWQMFKRNYERMMQQRTDNELYSTFLEYFKGVGEWSDKGMGLEEITELANHAGKPVNLLEVWRSADTHDSSGANGLVKFALRLFSIVPNSAGVERLFSLMGIIQTKLRNRIGVEKSRKVVLVKADINRTYGSGRQEQRRHFGDKVDVLANPEGAVPPLSNPIPSPEPTGPTTDSAIVKSFSAVATELLEMAAEEDTEDEEDSDDLISVSEGVRVGQGESGVIPHLASPLEPVPRGAAAYQLKYLFNYPPHAMDTTGTSHEGSGEVPMPFWGQSRLNLGKEQVAYERDSSDAADVAADTFDTEM
ncbi:ribonuclease H-like domain-containing protein [Cubamyces lactineus]|nr:ribonuclease H-like domain-containing protein [Cubamyces lactineus]